MSAFEMTGTTNYVTSNSMIRAFVFVAVLFANLSSNLAHAVEPGSAVLTNVAVDVEDLNMFESRELLQGMQVAVTGWQPNLMSDAAAHVAGHTLCVRDGNTSDLCQRRSHDFERLAAIRQWAAKQECWEKVLEAHIWMEEGTQLVQRGYYKQAGQMLLGALRNQLQPCDNPVVQKRWAKGVRSTESAFGKARTMLSRVLILLADCLLEIGRHSPPSNDYRGIHCIGAGQYCLRRAMQIDVEDDWFPNDYINVLQASFDASAVDLLNQLTVKELHPLSKKVKCVGCNEKSEMVKALANHIDFVSSELDPIFATPDFEFGEITANNLEMVLQNLGAKGTTKDRCKGDKCPEAGEMHLKRSAGETGSTFENPWEFELGRTYELDLDEDMRERWQYIAVTGERKAEEGLVVLMSSRFEPFTLRSQCLSCLRDDGWGKEMCYQKTQNGVRAGVLDTRTADDGHLRTSYVLGAQMVPIDQNDGCREVLQAQLGDSSVVSKKEKPPKIFITPNKVTVQGIPGKAAKSTKSDTGDSKRNFFARENGINFHCRSISQGAIAVDITINLNNSSAPVAVYVAWEELPLPLIGLDYSRLVGVVDDSDTYDLNFKTERIWAPASELKDRKMKTLCLAIIPLDGECSYDLHGTPYHQNPYTSVFDMVKGKDWERSKVEIPDSQTVTMLLNPSLQTAEVGYTRRNKSRLGDTPLHFEDEVNKNSHLFTKEGQTSTKRSVNDEYSEVRDRLIKQQDHHVENRDKPLVPILLMTCMFIATAIWNRKPLLKLVNQASMKSSMSNSKKRMDNEVAVALRAAMASGVESSKLAKAIEVAESSIGLVDAMIIRRARTLLTERKKAEKYQEMQRKKAAARNRSNQEAAARIASKRQQQAKEADAKACQVSEENTTGFVRLAENDGELEGRRAAEKARLQAQREERDLKKAIEESLVSKEEMYDDDLGMERVGKSVKKKKGKQTAKESEKPQAHIVPRKSPVKPKSPIRTQSRFDRTLRDSAQGMQSSIDQHQAFHNATSGSGASQNHLEHRQNQIQQLSTSTKHRDVQTPQGSARFSRGPHHTISRESREARMGGANAWMDHIWPPQSQPVSGQRQEHLQNWHPSKPPPQPQQQLQQQQQQSHYGGGRGGGSHFRRNIHVGGGGGSAGPPPPGSTGYQSNRAWNTLGPSREGLARNSTHPSASYGKDQVQRGGPLQLQTQRSISSQSTSSLEDDSGEAGIDDILGYVGFSENLADKKLSPIGTAPQLASASGSSNFGYMSSFNGQVNSMINTWGSLWSSTPMPSAAAGGQDATLPSPSSTTPRAAGWGENDSKKKKDPQYFGSNYRSNDHHQHF